MNIEFALIPDFGKPGLIEPLDPYIDNPKLTDKAWLALDDIFQGPLGSGIWNGQQYAIPVVSESSILCYRKDLIDKAPETVEEFAAVARAHKTSDVAGVALRGQRGAGLNVYIWSGFLYGFGGSFVADYANADFHPTVNAPEAIQAVDYYASLLRDAGPAGAANYTNEEVQVDGQNGATAMLIEWSGVPILIDNVTASKTAGKWAFAQVPKGPAGRFPSLYNTVFSLNASSKNKEAAWGLLQALVAPAPTLHYAQGEILATRKSVADSDIYKSGSRSQIVGFDQWVPVNSEALATAKPEYVPRIPHWQEFGDRVGIALQSAISGQATAQVAMDQAQADITKLLKDASVI
jgi:ABC-type glycerol-3-phosphate transport system substrate-binding protein